LAGYVYKGVITVAGHYWTTGGGPVRMLCGINGGQMVGPEAGEAAQTPIANQDCHFSTMATFTLGGGGTHPVSAFWYCSSQLWAEKMTFSVSANIIA
jgi:hypothetical protein